MVSLKRKLIVLWYTVWDDYVVYYTKECKYALHRLIDRIRHWIALWKVTKQCYDFDWTSIYALGTFQMDRVRNTLSKYKYHVDWERDVEKINLALRLYEIAESESSAYLVDPRGSSEFGTLYDFKHRVWRCDHYVNVRNARRYIHNDTYVPSKDEMDPSKYAMMCGTLRDQKAWVLFHRVMEQYSRNWWD